jgi:hypothetical protein
MGLDRESRTERSEEQRRKDKKELSLALRKENREQIGEKRRISRFVSFFFFSLTFLTSLFYLIFSPSLQLGSSRPP